MAAPRVARAAGGELLLFQKAEGLGDDEALFASRKRVAEIEAHHLAAADQSLDLIRREAKRPPVSAPPVARQDAGADLERLLEVVAEPGQEGPTAGVPALPTLDRENNEDHIVRSPVSEARKQEFLTRYLEDRARAGTAEALCRRAEKLHPFPQWNPLGAIGFAVLLQKGPFVEGSSWLPYSTWEFAVAVERTLLGQFEGRLRDASPQVRLPRPGVELTWEAILAKADELAGDVPASQEAARLIVVAGVLEAELLAAIRDRATPQWELEPDLRRPWIIGAYHSIPILNIRDTPTPAIYVVDLARFATLWKYGSTPEFSIEDFDEARAAELLRQRPDLLSDPPSAPDPQTQRERIRRLRLRVGLRLFESYGWIVDHPNAVSGARLAAPSASPPGGVPRRR